MYDKNAELYRNPDSKLSVDEQMKKFSPLGRVGTPSDIANVVAFLAIESSGCTRLLACKHSVADTRYR